MNERNSTGAQLPKLDAPVFFAHLAPSIRTRRNYPAITSVFAGRRLSPRRRRPGIEADARGIFHVVVRQRERAMINRRAVAIRAVGWR